MADSVDDDTIYVALSKDVEASKLTLFWALRNLRPKKVCILHVHQPTDSASSSSTNVAAVDEDQDEETRQVEVTVMYDDYLDACRLEGVHPENFDISFIEMADIGEGIVELVYRHGAMKLVMGAAADEHYSLGMISVTSQKAKYVLQLVSQSCIWFVCSGNLIQKRVENLQVAEAHIARLISFSYLSFKFELVEQLNHMEGEFDRVNITDIPSSSHASSVAETGQPNESSYSRSDSIASSDRIADGPLLLEYEITRTDEEFTLQLSNLTEEDGDVQIYRQLEEALVETESSKQEAFEESIRRIQAQKDAIEAIRRARTSESMHKEASRHIKESEEALAKEKEEFEKTKQERDEALSKAQECERMYNEEMRLRKETEEALAKEKEEHEKTKQESVARQLYDEELRLRTTKEEALTKKEEELEEIKKELAETRLIAQDTQQLIDIYKNERDEMIEERNNALKVTEELLENIVEDHSASGSQPAEIPSYFTCPISQEIMKDPQVAADGFTYEAESLKDWLSRGHQTSPMTNLILPNSDLIPNNPLRSAIQEWLQRSS